MSGTGETWSPVPAAGEHAVRRPGSGIRDLAEALGLPPALAALCLSRGLTEVEAVRRWLEPDARDLHDPFLFRDMQRSVDRIEAAIRDRETILIHGDYDVDGLTGTAVLARTLRFLGAEVETHLPARQEGYSFNEASLRRITALRPGLCLSVDNGTAAIDAVGRIQELGCDVIVTDHHHAGPEVAPAFAILNPRLADSGYPFADLAGVGVAFKLAWALLSRTRGTSRNRDGAGELLAELMALVALGTVADLVPLVGENRVLVRRGLKALAQPPTPGLTALVRSLGPRRRPLDTRDIGFGIGPRLNAAGRMAHADLALALLLDDDEQRARDRARQLDALNRSRQRTEARCFGQALNRLEAAERDGPRPVVLVHDADWPLGVLGILAARLSQRFGRPSLALTTDRDRARGSGRSPDGVDLRALLGRVEDPALKFGGHARAVGLELPVERLPALAEALDRAARELAPPPPPAPLRAEAEAALALWGRRELTLLNDFGPFGPGHAEPCFAAHDLVVGAWPRCLGADNRDLALTLVEDGRSYRALGPGLGPRIEELGRRGARLRVLYTPRWSDEPELGPVLFVIRDFASR